MAVYKEGAKRTNRLGRSAMQTLAEMMDAEKKQYMMLPKLDFRLYLGALYGEFGLQPDCGDPINVVTGNFHIEQVDMILQGSEPILFGRNYNTQCTYNGKFGHKWMMDYVYNLSENDGFLTVIWPDGRVEEFLEENGKYVGKNSICSRMEYDGKNGCYLITDLNGTLYTLDKSGRLIERKGKTGAVTEFVYADGMLVRIENECGWIGIGYKNGLVERVWDAIGREVRYKYENGNLVAVRNINGGVTRYVYDAAHRIVETVNPNGVREVRNKYDVYDRVVEQVVQESGVVSLYYDEEEKTTTVTNPDGEDTVYKRDERGFVTEIATNGGTILRRYDGLGNLMEFVDKNGNTTSYVHGDVFVTRTPVGDETVIKKDARGNVVAEVRPDGGEMVYEYDEANRLVREITPEGREIGFVYEFDRLSAVILPDGSEKRLGYDARGNMIEETDFEAAKTVREYDAVNRMVGEVRPNGGRTGYMYNAIDLACCQENADGTKSYKEYDAVGNVSAVIREDGSRIQYTYNKQNKIQKIINAEGGVTEYEYDVLGNAIIKFDADGGVISYGYDRAGNMVCEVDQVGRETGYRHDANGNVIERLDRNGNKHAYEYDGLNRVIKEINANGQVQLTEYRYDGKIMKKTGFNGESKSYEYNLDGQIVKVKDAFGADIKYTYNAVGLVDKKIDALGSETSYCYNRNGKMIEVKYPDETTETMAYDANGNMVKHVDQEGYETEFEYDLMDRIVGIRNPLGGWKKCTYNAVGKVACVKDENGYQTNYFYDCKDNLTEVHAPDGGRALYEYDLMDRLTAVKMVGDAGEPAFSLAYKYDLLGRPVEEINALGQVTAYRYDAEGNLIEKLDRDGSRIRMAYDAVNNLKKVQYGSEKVVTYEHDGLGNVIEMLDWLGTTTFERDLVGRITKVRDYKNAVSEFSYGMNGERTKIAYPSGRKAEYEYDEMGRMVGIKTEAGETKYTYSNVGRVTTELLPDGQKSLYEYDGIGNVTSLKHLDEKGNTLEERKYSYDLAGIKVSAEINKTKMGYEYDGMRRLTRVSEDGRAVEEYDYDILGNRKKMTKKRQSQGENVWYDYNKLNQLTEVWGTGARLMGQEIKGKAKFDYDERGNLLRICDGDKTIAEYRYDGTNRLVQSETDGKGISYDYDGLGRRTRKDDVEYVTDPMSRFNQLLETVKGGQREDYVQGRFTAAVIGEDEVIYPRFDEAGSLILMSDCKVEYDSFGNRINGDGKNEIFSYDGYEDDGNGMYFVQARYYIPEIGRWGSEDANRGKVADPETLNYYVFCKGNPVGYVDLDGKEYVIVQHLSKTNTGFGYQKVDNAYVDVTVNGTTTRVKYKNINNNFIIDTSHVNGIINPHKEEKSGLETTNNIKSPIKFVDSPGTQFVTDDSAALAGAIKFLDPYNTSGTYNIYVYEVEKNKYVFSCSPDRMAGGTSITYQVKNGRLYDSSGREIADLYNLYNVKNSTVVSDTMKQVIKLLNAAPVVANRYDEKGEPNEITIPIKQYSDALVFTSVARCCDDGILTDDQKAKKSSWHDDNLTYYNNLNLNPYVIPYVVLPYDASDQTFINRGVLLGDVVAVIYGNRIVYGVYIDNGPSKRIGEVSMKIHQVLFNVTNPKEGHEGPNNYDVMYVVFPQSRNNAFGKNGKNDELGLISYDGIQTIGRRLWREYFD